nr:MAG TPA: hypothetical protein [Caudoviricetes sp.]
MGNDIFILGNFIIKTPLPYRFYHGDKLLS